MSDAEDIQKEVENNFAAFKALLPSLQKDLGKYALLRERKLIAVYDTFGDALKTAESFYKDRRYSIQKIITKPVDLGYRSRAVVRR